MSGVERANLLVTGASGQIGQEVCRLLQGHRRAFVATDVESDSGVLACDLRDHAAMARLFEKNSIGGVIHLASVLPTAFHKDPLTAVDVNLGGTFELLRQSVKYRISRFVFASSMSVFGTSFDRRPRNENDPAVPADPYGAAKRVVEVIGDNLARSQSIEFVALRIARVVGPGARRTSSPWRSQIFEERGGKALISIPFAADAYLSVVHVDDVAQELLTLIDAPRPTFNIYNTPAETFQASVLRQLLEEVRGLRVELALENRDGGPLCDGRRFAKEFNFIPKTLKDRLLELDG
jgi:nucleoside-diphosphate-sugar epimerase